MTENIMEETYLTYNEVQQKFHISRSTLCRWAKSGKLKIIRISNRPRIPLKEFEKLIINH